MDFLKIKVGANKMVQWVKMLATNLDLSLIPSTHTVEEENQFLKVVL